uniref:Uncharacterized protein n=1 Tax=Candidatus Kentrum sp. LFY TaxID=2126342 RepID=A0A450WK29_9GAMM|nr:MAG: hypothetical protein BECKLFY1418C_GA0070996_10318 [Candidatus Kentron sp. LFY]
MRTGSLGISIFPIPPGFQGTSGDDDDIHAGHLVTLDDLLAPLYAGRAVIRIEIGEDDDFLEACLAFRFFTEFGIPRLHWLEPYYSSDSPYTLESEPPQVFQELNPTPTDRILTPWSPTSDPSRGYSFP